MRRVQVSVGRESFAGTMSDSDSCIAISTCSLSSRRRYLSALVIRSSTQRALSRRDLGLDARFPFRLSLRRSAGLPGSWRIPLLTCPALRTPEELDLLALRTPSVAFDPKDGLGLLVTIFRG